MSTAPRTTREIDGKGRTVRELRAGRKYSIDYYQREYKWQQKQHKELIDDLSGAALPYFVDGLVENVHLVEITAYSNEDAYTIFETMNDRLARSLHEQAFDHNPGFKQFITESGPLADGDDPADAQGVPNSVRFFFDREVKPYVPDAWIDSSKRDEKDGRVGLVGYEINFNRYFYKYIPPRPLEEIEAGIRAIEKDIMRMLAEITENRDG